MELDLRALDLNMGIAIFLCDITGKMAEPWLAAGYHCVLVDPQHPAGVHTDGLVTRIGDIIIGCTDFLGAVIRTGRVAFVMGFPPCTDVAVSGSRWFAAKAAKDPHFQAKAALVAEQCRMTGALSGAPWAFENPVSVFSSIFGKPQHTFSPDDFTGHCANDNYTKKTCLWASADFVMPAQFRDTTLGAPDDRIHKAPPGPERANFRSATPAGFATAVFLANAPHLKPAANDNTASCAAMAS
jgi:hypothetical protein